MLRITDEGTYNDAVWEIEGSSKARLVTATPDLDKTIAYVCRVSSKTQENPSITNLIRYCLRAGHWSIAETGSITMEMVTPLAIAMQVKRHRSFTFQAFSGRYADQRGLELMTDGLPTCEQDLFYMPEQARLQDTKNRQNSITTDDHDLNLKMQGAFEDVMSASYKAYNRLLELGIAREMARFVLPQNTYTRFFMTGSPRSWIHYLNVRDEEGVVQEEHVHLAKAAKRVFSCVCPTLAEAAWEN